MTIVDETLKVIQVLILDSEVSFVDWSKPEGKVKKKERDVIQEIEIFFSWLWPVIRMSSFLIQLKRKK